VVTAAKAYVLDIDDEHDGLVPARETQGIEMTSEAIVAAKEWGLIITVDPAAFSIDHTYTIEQELDGAVQRWTNARPQWDDGDLVFFLPISKQ
jgi:hypothetical protein